MHAATASEMAACRPARREGRFGEALARYQESSAESSDLPDYRLQLPAILFDAGRQSEAIEMLQGFVAEFPQCPDYRDELAFLYERRATQICEAGRCAEAIPMLRKLAAEFPQRPDFRP